MTDSVPDPKRRPADQRLPINRLPINRSPSHHRTASRLLPLAIALLAALSSLHAQTPDPAADRTLFLLTNQIRTEHHLAPFTWDPALAIAARKHALYLAADPGPLEHQYPGEPDLLTRAAQAGASFHAVSENLARGNTGPAAIAQLWMQTPIHRANLLNPQLTSIGIAVVNRDGVLFAVQDFSRAAPAFSRDAIEAHVQQLLESQGLASVTISQLARSTCETHATTAASARLLIQWEGDTSLLPEALLQQLQQSHFDTAAVGACPGAHPSGSFASARVAVLLF